MLKNSKCKLWSSKKTVRGVLILPFMAVNPQVGFGLLFAGIKGGGNAKEQEQL